MGIAYFRTRDLTCELVIIQMSGGMKSRYVRWSALSRGQYMSYVSQTRCGGTIPFCRTKAWITANFYNPVSSSDQNKLNSLQRVILRESSCKAKRV